MDRNLDLAGMLNVTTAPAFLAKENIITHVNTAAQGLLIEEGASVLPMLHSGANEYADFQDGCLYVTLEVSGTRMGAAVHRFGQGDLFLLEQAQEQTELRALALAAQELREPMSGIMAGVEELLAARDGSKQTPELSRSLYRMLRILGNMSDAGHVCSLFRPETVDICSVFHEIFQKAAHSLGQAGWTLHHSVPESSIYCMADPALLERGFLNMLSNAMKHASPAMPLEARLTRRERMLCLTLHDNGDGIPREQLPSVFTRYLRQPTIEDGRQGIGLGMVVIRNVASHHGGTVLVRSSKEQGTQITMTIPIRQSEGTVLRSPALRVDYGGEWDHPLLELSDCLPGFLFE